MRIENIVHVNAVPFEQIEDGGVFEFNEIIYMKTEPCDNKTLGILLLRRMLSFGIVLK